MNEAYLLYRTLQYRKIRKSFLDYFLKQINVSIQTICRDLGINGAIVAKSTSFNYDDLLQKLVSGELKYSQLTDYAFPTRHE